MGTGVTFNYAVNFSFFYISATILFAFKTESIAFIDRTTQSVAIIKQIKQFQFL